MNLKSWKYSLISALAISGALSHWQGYALAQCSPGEQPCYHHNEPPTVHKGGPYNHENVQPVIYDKKRGERQNIAPNSAQQRRQYNQHTIQQPDQRTIQYQR